MPSYIYKVGDLETVVGRIGKGRSQVALVSDEELLRTISEDLRSFYADIVCQPLPPKIEAALARIDRVQSHGSNLSRPAAHWAGTSLKI